MLQAKEKAGAVFFSVRAQPRSSASTITGEHDGNVKVNLKAPPVNGKANLECRRLLAKTLGVPCSRVRIVSGMRGKLKQVRVEGVSAAEFAQRIKPYL